MDELKTTELNKYGEVIDRGGAHWRLAAPPTISIMGDRRDLTAELGLRKPNIWSEGGHTYRVEIILDLFVPIGASGNLEDLLSRVESALRS